MKTKRKLRQRLLPIDFATVANPMSEERVRAAFDRMRQTLAGTFAVKSKTP